MSIYHPAPTENNSSDELPQQIAAIFKRERFRVLGEADAVAAILALPALQQALAVERRVRSLHRPARSVTTEYCSACSERSDTERTGLDWNRLVNWPCPTIRALGGDA